MPRYFWTVVYLLSVPFVNFLFATVPRVQTPIGIVGIGAVVVGFTFVIRDYCQREIGHFVLAATIVGIIASYFLAAPFVATASALAFAASEMADYMVFTVTKRPFRDRVLISQLVSAPIDSLVFLMGISQMTAGAFAVMTASKLLATFVIIRIPHEAKA